MKTLAMLTTFVIVSAITATTFANGTKVPQYAYLLDLRAPMKFNPDTGEKETTQPPRSEMEILRDAGTIRSVEFYKHDDKQLLIYIEGGNLVRSTVFLVFKESDSARILKNALTNGNESFVLIVDYFDRGVKLDSNFLTVKGSAAYVWDDKTQTIAAIGNMIGPKRSVDDQSKFDQFMTWIFGRSYLNKVNYIDVGARSHLKEI